MAVTPVTIEVLRRRLVEEHKATVSIAFPKGNWAFLARKYGVDRVVMWRLVNNDYEPRKRDIRRKLGLQEVIHQSIVRDAAGRFTRPKS